MPDDKVSEVPAKKGHAARWWLGFVGIAVAAAIMVSLPILTRHTVTVTYSPPGQDPGYNSGTVDSGGASPAPAPAPTTPTTQAATCPDPALAAYDHQYSLTGEQEEAVIQLLVTDLAKGQQGNQACNGLVFGGADMSAGWVEAEEEIAPQVPANPVVTFPSELAGVTSYYGGEYLNPVDVGISGQSYEIQLVYPGYGHGWDIDGMGLG